MIHLFIDTNAFLNFYHYSDEDLGRLSDLQSLMNETDAIKLHITSQVVDEFKRNREVKINDSLKQFGNVEIKPAIPNICQGYEETAKLQELASEFAKNKKSLIEKINADIAEQSLKADKIIRAIFAQSVVVSDQIVKAAMLRLDLGKPPGKNKSYGDAINWEYLLKHVPDGEDLHFVSSDRDYLSPLDSNRFSLYLSEEWGEEKGSSIHYHKTLRAFFKEKFPEVDVFRDEYIKDSKIGALENSRSFDAARAALKQLSKIQDFSDEQIDRIVKASVTNDQIYNAHSYSPELIGLPLHGIISKRRPSIDPDLLEKFDIAFEMSDDDEDLDFDL